jgi:hypothetical protein
LYENNLGGVKTFVLLLLLLLLLSVKHVNMLLLLLLLLVVAEGRDPINIYWNSSNPMFSASSSPTLLDVNKNTGPWEYDQINLICPSGPHSTEKHIIYSVSRDEYERCEIGSTSSALIVAVCDQPQNFLYFTITFRYFSPSPRQLEFKPGETYFFISTSGPENLLRREGGYCSSNNMKIKFRIAERHLGEEVPGGLVPLPTAFWSKYWRSRLPDSRDLYPRPDQDLARSTPYTSSSTVHRAASWAVLLLLVIYL